MADGSTGSLVATAFSPGGFSNMPKPADTGGDGAVITTGQHTQRAWTGQSAWPPVRRSNSAHSLLGDDEPTSTARYVHTIKLTDSTPTANEYSTASRNPREGSFRRLHSYDGLIEADHPTDWAGLWDSEDMAYRSATPRSSGHHQYRYVIRTQNGQQVRGYPSPHRHQSPPVRYHTHQPVGQKIYVHGPRTPQSPGPVLVRGPPPLQGHVIRQGQVVYTHPGGYATTPRKMTYNTSPRTSTPPASAQRLYVKHSMVHLNRSGSKASHASHASSSGIVARAQGGARPYFPTMPRLVRSNSTGDLLDEQLHSTYQTLPKNFGAQKEHKEYKVISLNEPMSPGYSTTIPRAPDVPPFHPPPLIQPTQALPRAVETKPEVRSDGVVYHGHYVKVSVPRYFDEAPNETGSLHMSKLRYHSEPNLADLDSDDLDDNVVFRTSNLPERSVTPTDSRSESPVTPPLTPVVLVQTPVTQPEVLVLTPTTPVEQVSDVTSGQDAQRENAPRTVVLQRGNNGFGFVLRGAKAQHTAGSSLDFTPTNDFPALQYLDRVDKQSPADRAGLKPGDFLLEINGEVVVNATHEHTVNLIKRSGDTLAMKVITVKPLSPEGLERDTHADGTRTLPLKKKAPAPPRRDPHTSLTASRATGRAIRDSLEEIEKLDISLSQYAEAELDSAAMSKGVDINNKTASIRARQAHARLTTYELEDMMSRQGMTQADVHHSASSQNKPMIPTLPKTYNSVADMKKKNGNGTLSKNHRAISTPNLAQEGEMQIYQNSAHTANMQVSAPNRERVQSGYSRQASTPDSSTLGRRMHNGSAAVTREQTYAVPSTPQRHYGSVENVLEERVPAGGQYIIPPHPREPAPAPPRVRSGIPAPPDHPPPIPPHDRTPTEVVKITKSPTYANVSAQIQQQKKKESDYESSFRPGIGARLNKEPIVPENVGLRKLAHSRSSSNVSSGSDHSGEQKPANVRGAVEIFEQHSSAHGMPTRKVSASYAEDSAARYVKEHPGANVLYTADQKRPNGSHIYEHEPEPDYDDTDHVSKNILAVRSLRETRQLSGHQSHQLFQTSPHAGHHPTQRAHVSETHYASQINNAAGIPSTPKTPEEDDNGSMSAFTSAIKAAASAREQKRTSPPSQPPPPPVLHNREQTSQSSRHRSAPNAPPPPPPPPPPSTSESRASPVPVRNSTPPQTRRPVDEEKRQNDPHAALMAAIVKQRGLVEKRNGGALANNIEEQIQRNKNASTVNGSKMDEMSLKSHAPPPPKASPPKELMKQNPAPGPTPTTTNSPSPSDEPQNFRAMAERARQEYLQKKAAGTLDRRKGSPSSPSHSSPLGPKAADEEEKENEQNKTKMVKQCSPSPAVSQETNNGGSSGNNSGLGDIASVIAQRAKERQKGTSNIVDSNGNRMNDKSSHSTVYKSPVTNNNGGSRQRGDGGKGMEVKGATIDVSHTESPRDERLSVFARARIFESSKNQGKSPSSNGANFPFDLPPPVIETNGSYIANDIPPPMITPPPPGFDYSHSPDLGVVSNGDSRNNHETVGWVINSSPPRYADQHYVFRNKSSMIANYSSPQKENLVDDVQVDFIPPPPLFDGDLGSEPALHTGKVVAEDAASMVSSLSTLSTVSSSEHESYQHDSSGYSSSRNRFTPLHNSSGQTEEVFPEVAPPPPGFDDGGDDFIPPPMGFGLSGSENSQPVNNFRHNLRSTGQGGLTYQNKPVQDWNTQDICDWLDSMNLGHLSIHFIRAGVQGDQLTRMGGQDYQMLGITSPDQRNAVERAVRRVQLNQ